MTKYILLFLVWGMGILPAQSQTKEQVRAKVIAIEEEALVAIENYDIDIAFKKILSAKDIVERNLDTESPLYAGILSQLGGLYLVHHEFDKAIKCSEEAIRIYESTIGPYCFDKAVPLETLGGVATAQEDYKKAILYRNKKIDVLQFHLPDRDAELLMATSYRSLADVYVVLSQLDSAQYYIDRSISFYEYNLPADMLTILSYHYALTSKANILITLGEYKAAKVLLDKIRKNFTENLERFIAPEHAQLARSSILLLDEQIAKHFADFAKADSSRVELDKFLSEWSGILPAFYQDIYTGDTSYSHYKKRWELFDSVYGSNSLKHSNDYEHIALGRSFVNDFDSAVCMYNKALAIYSEKLGCVNKKSAEIYLKLANIYYELYQLDSVEACLNRSRKMFGEDELGIIKCNILSAKVLRDKQKFNEADSLLLENLLVVERKYNRQHIMYAFALRQIADSKLQMKQYKDAENLYKMGINFNNKKLGKLNFINAYNYVQLAEIEIELNNFKKASEYIQYAEEGIDLYRSDKAYSWFLNNGFSADFHPNACRIELLIAKSKIPGIHNDSVEYYLNYAYQLAKTDTGLFSRKFVDVAREVAWFYFAMGNKEIADSVIQVGVIVLNKGRGRQIESAKLLLLHYEFKRANGQADITPILVAKKIFEETYGNNHPDYLLCLEKEAGFYERMGSAEKSDSLYGIVCQKYENLYGREHETYVLTLNGQIENAFKVNDTVKIRQLQEEIVALMKRLFGEGDKRYLAELRELGAFYFMFEEYNKAREIAEKAMDGYIKYYDEACQDLANSIWLLAQCCIKTGDYSAADSLYESVVEQRMHVHANNQLFLTEAQVESYYYAHIDFLFSDYKKFLIEVSDIKKDAAKSLWEFNLATKGRLADDQKQLKNAIYNSNNNALKEDYNEFLTLKNIINRQHMLPKAQQRDDISTLEIQATHFEKLIRRKAGVSHAHHLRKPDVDYATIRKNLKTNERVVDFTSIPTNKGISYYAIVFGREDTIPQLIYLCENNELLEVIDKIQEPVLKLNRYSTHPALGDHIRQVPPEEKAYNLIWKPIVETGFLDDAESVYYSPSGLLHILPFAALKDPDGLLLCKQQYELAAISTSRKLLDEDPLHAYTPKDISLFGGIRYETDTASWLRAVNYKNNTSESLYASRSLGSFSGRDRASLRSGFDSLPGSAEEVLYIDSVAKQMNIETEVRTDIGATEEAFKSMAGCSPEVLHIATHGFYFQLEEPDTRAADRQQGEQKYATFFNPMYRTGLAMAGANLSWQDRDVPESLEDGILYANEISNLWLNNTKLVVVSACQSGQGDISGNEGVYGLQRAFKIAGAEYILMSLWKIDDKETMEFMEIFYAKWLKKDKNGNSLHIRSAFNETQDEMRRRYPDSNNWAAFVLIR